MTSPAGKVLLIGWDAADWQIIHPLLDRGEMPILGRLVREGVMGNLSSLQPMLSPSLWNSIATGKRPFKHGIHGFTEVDAGLNQPVAASSFSRRCKAVWNILNENGLKTHAVGWFASHPAEPLDGACVSERFPTPPPTTDPAWPLAPGTIHPPRLEEALADLRVRPEEITGEVLSLFVPRAAEINQRYDKRLHILALRLAECFTVHAAITYLLEHEPWDFAAVYYHAIDWICHDFMTFHPPRMSGIHDREFDLYSDVVTSIYRLSDLLLGRLLQLAGEETTVLIVSDHGFKSGPLRPASLPNTPAAIAGWHRPTGVLAMRGPGLRRDELIHGASLLDLTPTILTLFGLPVGRDMDGRVLIEAFERTPEIATIESWEGLASDSGPQRPAVSRSAEDEQTLLRQFIAIGYINDPSRNPSEAIRDTERENRWHLALSYLDAGRFVDALPLLESVYEEWPERAEFCFELARCQLNLGLHEEALETAEGLAGRATTPGGALLLANIEFRRGNYEASLEHLARAEAADPQLVGLQNQVGLTRLRLRQLELAEQAYVKAVALDPDDPRSHLGLAHCQLRTHRYLEAAESALRAIGLRFDLPLGHYHLGLALARIGDETRAIVALETCLRYRPNWTPAHRHLARLYLRQPGGETEAKEHREQLKEREARHAEQQHFLEKLRQEAAERAGNRANARRERRERPAATPEQIDGPPCEPMEFLLVSGLPRSGTSLMMQILQAADLEIMTDQVRAADTDNVRGYFEWEEIKQLPKNPRIIEKAQGRVIKVISMLLPSLPVHHRYRVIFMNRSIEDVIASQEKMRRRLSTDDALPDRNRMISHLHRHQERMLEMLRASPNVALLEVDYRALLQDPPTALPPILEFAALPATKLGIAAGVIDPDLCHHR